MAYRISAAQRARAGRIGGYARNLADGRVEVLACGELRDVEAFIAWLWTGPAAARVIEVSVESIEPDPDTMQLDRFTTA